jgi:DamX protein
VDALGSKIQGYQQVGPQILINLAKVLAKTEAAQVVVLLPQVCAQLPSPPRKDSAPKETPTFDVALPDLSPQSRAVLLLYKLISYYGDQRVGVALDILASQAAPPPSTLTPTPAPEPAPAPEPEPETETETEPDPAPPAT